MKTELFEPFDTGGLRLANRFVRSATWDATADDNGNVTEETIAVYDTLGSSGIGLIITGYAFVSPIGKAATRQISAHTDTMIPGLRRITEAAHQRNSKIVLQIAHSGTNAAFRARDEEVELLAVAEQPDVNRPYREMDEEDIQETMQEFARAAARAKEAGFDGVQLHGAHGYLMSQFQSPIINHRRDKWGGTAENRRRFHLDVLHEIRKKVGVDFPLMIKYGLVDYDDGGLSLSEGLETVRLMVDAGIDAVEISAASGPGLLKSQESGDAGHVYFRESTAAVKKIVNVPVMMVGGIRSLETAQDIVDKGDADLISMCRPFIREPDLLSRWAKEDRSQARCISCFKCLGIAIRGEPLRCAEEPS